MIAEVFSSAHLHLLTARLTLSILNDVDLLALDDHLDDGSGTGRLALVDAGDAEGILLLSSLDTKALATGQRLLGLSPGHHEGLVLEPKRVEASARGFCGEIGRMRTV